MKSDTHGNLRISHSCFHHILGLRNYIMQNIYSLLTLNSEVDFIYKVFTIKHLRLLLVFQGKIECTSTTFKLCRFLQLTAKHDSIVDHGLEYLFLTVL